MNEEHAIFLSQQLYLIYTHPVILYEIIPSVPLLNFEPKFKPRPHSDGIVVAMSTKFVYQVMNQMRNFSINHHATGKSMASSKPTQSMDVHSIH